VPQRFERLHQMLLEQEARVIRADGNAH
jgi:hypothetical protein